MSSTDASPDQPVKWYVAAPITAIYGGRCCPRKITFVASSASNGRWNAMPKRAKTPRPVPPAAMTSDKPIVMWVGPNSGAQSSAAPARGTAAI